MNIEMMDMKPIYSRGVLNVLCIPFIKHLLTNVRKTLKINITMSLILAFLSNTNLGWGKRSSSIFLLGCSPMKILFYV